MSYFYFQKYNVQNAGDKDTEFYRVENRRLNDQLDMLRDQSEELKRDVADAVTERDKSEQDLELCRKQIKDLKSEVSVQCEWGRRLRPRGITNVNSTFKSLK